MKNQASERRGGVKYGIEGIRLSLNPLARRPSERDLHTPVHPMTLLPPDFLDCVVALGFPDETDNIHYLASGFFLARSEDRDNEGHTRHRVFLVTNRHVFDGNTSGKVRFNSGPEGPALVYNLVLSNNEGLPLWKTHADPSIDVCIVPVFAGRLQKQGIKLSFITVDSQTATMKACKEMGVSEGDGVYTLGFPMGLVGEGRNYVIARTGGIARIRDALSGNSKEFLIDTFIFPGNSGGPVFIRPEIGAIVGTTSVDASYLIGIVKGYLPYQEVAVSLQTNQPRVVFQENSGLAAVHPVDTILEVINTNYPYNPPSSPEAGPPAELAPSQT